jgi:hypothetical protein
MSESSRLFGNFTHSFMHARYTIFFRVTFWTYAIAEDVHGSDLASVWLKELHAVATLMGSKTKEAECLSSLQAIMNFLSKEKKIIGAIGGGWFKSSLKMILPWMRQIVSRYVSTHRAIFMYQLLTRTRLSKMFLMVSTSKGGAYARTLSTSSVRITPNFSGSALRALTIFAELDFCVIANHARAKRWLARVR